MEVSRRLVVSDRYFRFHPIVRNTDRHRTTTNTTNTKRNLRFERSCPRWACMIYCFILFGTVLDCMLDTSLAGNYVAGETRNKASCWMSLVWWCWVLDRRNQLELPISGCQNYVEGNGCPCVSAEVPPWSGGWTTQGCNGLPRGILSGLLDMGTPGCSQHHCRRFRHPHSHGPSLHRYYHKLD
jgi:hypothetical protein